MTKIPISQNIDPKDNNIHNINNKILITINTDNMKYEYQKISIKTIQMAKHNDDKQY